MRIAVLHTRLSGYFARCLQQLKSETNVELLIYAWPNQRSAPFDLSLYRELGVIRNRQEHSDSSMREALVTYKPDVILTSGWLDKGYVKICKAMRKLGVLVIAGCDTQWIGGLRQQIAGLTARYHVHRFIDVLWVTGERQAVLGRALGFAGERLWDGYYACDWDAFSEIAENRDFSKKHELPAFLYTGRYAPEKGLDTLAEAYQIYREKSRNSWRLICAGKGPKADLLIAAGAEDRGFVQPDALPQLFAEASVFILPSRFEPWGVVLQEAAASGLPLIASDTCGASVHLLRDGFNGFRFPMDKAEVLADRMLRISELEASRLRDFGSSSYELSKQYTPRGWVTTLSEGLSRF